MPPNRGHSWLPGPVQALDAGVHIPFAEDHNMDSENRTTNNVGGSPQEHVCPPPLKGMLPSMISSHAINGRVKEVFDWIANGGNINASDGNCHTLLHIACQHQQAELLKKLLEHPDIHFNPRILPKMGLTPIGIAACFEDTKILEILLDCAKSEKCVLSHTFLMEKGQKNIRTSAIIGAGQNQRWKAVRLLLEHYRDIKEGEAFSIFTNAIEDYQFDIAETIISGKFPFRDKDFSTHAHDVYQRKQWTLLDAIFRKCIRHNNDSCLKVFYSMYVSEDWENMEKCLCLLNGRVKIHSELLEHLMDEDHSQAERILATVRDRKEVVTGTLLAACICGTSEELADVLLNQNGVYYSNQTLDWALLLASMFYNVEFMQTLLLIKTFSFKILVRSHRASKYSEITEATELIGKIIDERVKKFSEVRPLR
ncbi:uncharacterized protein [Palaemon carinicauda]|uniref:uncharacterized protein n=1 Tax=Palaemon carinicauda TaxID=392227 RepID=UPI0035B5B3E4